MNVDDTADETKAVFLRGLFEILSSDGGKSPHIPMLPVSEGGGREGGGKEGGRRRRGREGGRGTEGGEGGRMKRKVGGNKEGGDKYVTHCYVAMFVCFGKRISSVVKSKRCNS